MRTDPSSGDAGHARQADADVASFRLLEKLPFGAALFRVVREPEHGAIVDLVSVRKNREFMAIVGLAASFGLDLTTEQMAAILYRYAQFKKYDVSIGEDTNILSYTDAFSISEYAIPAMQWACGAGLVQGNNGALMPQGAATRAQVAAIMMRYAQSAAK